MGTRPPSEFARAAYAEAIASQFQQQFGAAAQLPAGFAEMAGGAIASQFGVLPVVQQEGREPWTEDKAAPPISEAALRRLPIVRVTEEDLCVDGNDVCVVCLEPQRVGDAATRLPCGHLYHRECVVDWLRKHCTCPNCRYELQSDDPAFEKNRRQRMEARKPRYRLRDLNDLPLNELQRILDRRAKVIEVDDDVSSEAARRDALVRRVLAEKLVDVIPEPPPLALDCGLEGLRTAWTTRHLKQLMIRVGVDSTRCLEKKDLIDQLVASGRLELLSAFGSDDDTAAKATAALDKFLAEEQERGVIDDDESSLPPPPPAAEDRREEALSPDDVARMSVKQLKAELRKRGREDDVRNSVEKSDLIRALTATLSSSL